MLSKTELKGSTRIIWKLQKPLRKIPCPPRKWSNKRKKQNNSEKKLSKTFSKLSQIYRNQKKTKNICHLLITYHDYHILCVIFVAFLQLWFIHLIISCHQFCKFEALLIGSSDQTTNLESTNPNYFFHTNKFLGFLKHSKLSFLNLILMSCVSHKDGHFLFVKLPNIM